MGRVVDCAIIDAPDLASEDAARQSVIHWVKVAAPTCIQLPTAVADHVVAEPETWSELLGEREVEHVLPNLGPVRRDLFVLCANTNVEGETASDVPIIL